MDKVSIFNLHGLNTFDEYKKDTRQMFFCNWFRLCCRRTLTVKLGLCRSCGEPTRHEELCALCNAERVTGRLSGTDDELVGL